MPALTLILKTVERCNLNCSYCYFFNGLDDSYKKRPVFISKKTIGHLAHFIKLGIAELNITKVSIGLHGGEPLMQLQDDFIYLLDTVNSALPLKMPINFTIQTNATLVTTQWIDLLNKYKVGVGVSIDGPQEYHDKYRADHQGNGSHARVARGIELLQEGLLDKPSCLTVVNPEFDGKQIYKYLIGFGFDRLDFLLPDHTHDNPPLYPIKQYAEYLTAVFDEWAQNDNAYIRIRKFRSIMLQLLGQKPLIYGFGNAETSEIPLLAIRSDGSISPTDELASTNPNTVSFTGKNIQSHTLKEVIAHPIFNELNAANRTIPYKCSKCCWYGACGAGNLVSRFSNVNRFNNHSVYCEAFEELYAHITAYLIKSGIPSSTITDNLFKRVKVSV